MEEAKLAVEPMQKNMMTKKAKMKMILLWMAMGYP